MHNCVKILVIKFPSSVCTDLPTAAAIDKPASKLLPPYKRKRSATLAEEDSTLHATKYFRSIAPPTTATLTNPKKDDGVLYCDPSSVMVFGAREVASSSGNGSSGREREEREVGVMEEEEEVVVKMKNKKKVSQSVRSTLVHKKSLRSKKGTDD